MDDPATAAAVNRFNTFDESTLTLNQGADQTQTSAQAA